MVKKEEILAERITIAILKSLAGKKLVEMKMDQSNVKNIIKKIIENDLITEEKIVAEAREILKGYAKEIRDKTLDYNRLFLMVKSKLAKEKNFIL